MNLRARSWATDRRRSSSRSSQTNIFMFVVRACMSEYTHIKCVFARALHFFIVCAVTFITTSMITFEYNTQNFSSCLWFTSILWKFQGHFSFLFYLIFFPSMILCTLSNDSTSRGAFPSHLIAVSLTRNLGAAIVISYLLLSFGVKKNHLQISCVMEFNKVKFQVWDFGCSRQPEKKIHSLFSTTDYIVIIATDPIWLVPLS